MAMQGPNQEQDQNQAPNDAGANNPAPQPTAPSRLSRARQRANDLLRVGSAIVRRTGHGVRRGLETVSNNRTLATGGLGFTYAGTGIGIKMAAGATVAAPVMAGAVAVSLVGAGAVVSLAWGVNTLVNRLSPAAQDQNNLVPAMEVALEEILAAQAQLVNGQVEQQEAINQIEEENGEVQYYEVLVENEMIEDEQDAAILVEAELEEAARQQQTQNQQAADASNVSTSQPLAIVFSTLAPATPEVNPEPARETPKPRAKKARAKNSRSKK